MSNHEVTYDSLLKSCCSQLDVLLALVFKDDDNSIIAVRTDSKVSSESTRLIKALSATTVNLQSLEANARKKRKEINDAFDKIIHIVDRRRQSVLAQLDQVKNKNRGALSDQQEALRARITQTPSQISQSPRSALHHYRYSKC